MSLQETPNAAANHLKFSKMESKNNQNAFVSKLTALICAGKVFLVASMRMPVPLDSYI